MPSFKQKSFDIKTTENDKKVEIVDENTSSQYDVKHYDPQEIGSISRGDQLEENYKTRHPRFSVHPIVKQASKISQIDEEEVQTKVQQEMERVQEKAYAEGFEQGKKEGYEQGKQEGYEEIRPQAQDKLNNIETLMHSFEKARNEIFHENEHFLIHMVFLIAKKLALKEIEADEHYVTRLSKELIERIGLKENLKIQVNPNDINDLQAFEENLINSLEDYKNIQVETSENMTQGGCRVTSDWSTIESNLEHQLEQLRESLFLESNQEAS